MPRTEIEVGKRYCFMWPSRRPSMRLVGVVEEIKTTSLGRDARVKWSDKYPPHSILVDGARVAPAADSEPGAFQIKLRR